LDTGITNYYKFIAGAGIRAAHGPDEGYANRVFIPATSGTKHEFRRQLLMALRIRIQSSRLPKTWLGRVAGFLLAAVILVSAFFFLFFFLLVAGAVTLVVCLRLLWRARQVRARASPEVLEGEYSVEPAAKPAEIKQDH
jgi:hypothetical protein